jgi:hypothetical protein
MLVLLAFAQTAPPAAHSVGASLTLAPSGAVSADIRRLRATAEAPA